MNKKSIQNIAWAFLYAIWTAGAFLFVSVILVGLPLAYFASESVYKWFETPVGTLALAAIVYIVSAAIVISPFVVRRLPWGEIRKKLGIWKQFRLPMIPWAVFIWGLYFISTIIVTGILYTVHIPGLNLDQKQEIGFDHISGGFEYAIAFLLLVVIAPVFEELLFRGYLFGRIRERKGFWFSAILTSLTFAALHGQLNVGIDVFILSLFLCYLREKFQAIWPGVLVHALKNGLAYALLFILPLYGIRLV